MSTRMKMTAEELESVIASKLGHSPSQVTVFRASTGNWSATLAVGAGGTRQDAEQVEQLARAMLPHFDLI
ncbi:MULTISPECIES: hypothetical protein [Bradyrhizobium]|uniref:hypothetical protein n=1 Tax=Bradyrhizobium TaxID=374 RepID=UPI001EDA7782|nr:hypothetical protein [Bradyrhizobium zhengyangense]MCG2645508.1 hypothetical protein [Bradyrhizobium zhengyangense]